LIGCDPYYFKEFQISKLALKKQNPKHQTTTVKVVNFIEHIIEHRLFKPIAISIITSFVLFNGFSYLKGYLRDQRIGNQKITRESSIKINIPDDYGGFNLNQTQIVEKRLNSGETLSQLLFELGADEVDVFSILTETRKVYNPRNISAGETFTIKYQVQISYGGKKPSKEGKSSRTITKRKVFIDNISFSPIAEEKIQIYAVNNADGTYSYSAKKIVKKLTKHVVKYSATITNSLYVSGTSAGISPKIMIDMINLYSFDVDFQRDIRAGDKFEILFESFYDKDGNRVKDGDILYASFDLNKIRTIDMYIDKSNKNEYYDAKGRSVRKSLLKTPVNGARISSTFGRRKHPILGYRKMHKGIDFAVPRGTPIFAAGAGTITRYGRNGGYGNFVKIRHNKEYSTAYAHASRFARGLRVGSKVSQGQIIAYVGTTGRSTGPHLHYEILFKGKAINPSKVKSTSGKALSGKDLKRFMSGKKEIDALLKNTPDQNRF
jgi:murein DD-endopeptidase MepM/ murein hydrolase activator NlpD